MADPIELLRGMARGATADVMGGPVDLATMATNLGIAGAGYGAHKLGLIDEPWALIEAEDVPFSSDWLAKDTPLAPEEMSREYELGRIAPGLAGAGMSAVGGQINALRNAGPAAKQTGALYLDKRGVPQGDEFAVYHKTNLPRGTPDELDNVSFAVTHDSQDPIPQFGTDILVPDPKQLEPRSTPSRLHGTDAYTMRHGQTYSKGNPKNSLDIDDAEISDEITSTLFAEGIEPKTGPTGLVSVSKSDLDKVLDSSMLEPAFYDEIAAYRRSMDSGQMRDMARETVRNRQRDRELALPINERNKRLVNVEGGTVEDAVREPATLSFSSSFQHGLDREPLYRSIEEFLRSPYGGQRLKQGGDPRESTQLFDSRYGTLQDMYRDDADWKIFRLLQDSIQPDRPPLDQDRIAQLRDIAQGDNIPFIDVLRRPDILESVYGVDRAKMEQQRVNALFEELVRKGPSEYGEFKRYGPMRLSPTNFAGGVVGKRHSEFDRNFDMKRIKKASEELGKRDIPLFNAEELAPDEMQELIRALNTYGLTNRRDDSALRQFQELRMN